MPQENVVQLNLTYAYKFQSYLKFESVAFRDAFRNRCKEKRNRQLLRACNVASVPGAAQYPVVLFRCFTEAQFAIFLNLAKEFGGVECDLTRTP